MKKSTKLISILLAAAMIFAIAPLPAFAAESDGVPTVVDVSKTETNYYNIDKNNYDPDGFVFTGNNPKMQIIDSYGVDVTFKDLTFNHYLLSSDIDESITITLSGDNAIVPSLSYAIANWNVDVIINAEENASLSVTTKGYFITNSGWDGELTVNGGDISVTATAEGAGYSTICTPYTQNGGNVTISAKNNSAFSNDVVLNGGTLTASSDNQKIISNHRSLTIAPRAIFKGSSPDGMLYSGGSFMIAEGAPENSYIFAKTSPDGDFVLVRDASTLKNEKYLELKVDSHNHSFDNTNECICGIEQADYSEYDTAMDRYNSLINEYADSLIEDTKEYIRTQVGKIADEYLGNTGIKNNYTTDEQYILDGISDGINEICDTIEKGIEDGTFLKPDYTAIEARIAEFEQAHSGEEYAQLIAEIKSDLATIKESNPETHADVADGIAAIEAKIEKAVNCEHVCHRDGFMGFLWKIVNFFNRLFGLNPVCECKMAHY